MSLAELLETGCLAESGTEPKLSKPSRKLMDTFLVGSRAWAKGYCRAACIVAQHQAALDLMILEKSGAILFADTTSEATLDPITKSPFIFDPSTREL